ncbi:folliculin-interacting protein 2 [Microplitis demolitor]|uniref:folliculin-interacting protein 2 n=1 Tax=Microplitis demolitor TaxID=69319 RepID=UPI0004CDCD0F|nr:folliculin-interacting protein 2 [Microplitis demolitor]
MTLFDKLFASKKNNCNNFDDLLPLKIEFGTRDCKNKLKFGADQVRILLFRECEWRGRKLLFDSVSVKNDGNNVKCHDDSSCPRNGNGLPQESEKDPCDNVSLLSEMVFGTVAMTYRGPLFKVHTFDTSKCIMCCKVFPASDHNPHKQSGTLSDEALGTSNHDSNSSNGSTRNTLSFPSSGNFSTGSLRKSSTCSSTCSGWDIDVPLLGSSQSIDSNSSSGFSSLSSLRRRWLRAMSTSLSITESDEIFGFQPCGDTSGDIYDFNTRRHKTRLGLAILIKLTLGQERLMEVRLLEHAAQLEAMLNRLCYACIKPTRRKMNVERKGLTVRLHQTALRCTLWLLRLLMTTDNIGIPSIWHHVLLNSSVCREIRVNMLCRSFHQMSLLLNKIDTKSTNFFLSTLVTAVLTYHLGWVNTIMSSHDKTLIENIKLKYPYNPLWAQLGDLYGTLGNPVKFVNTVIVGAPEKEALINAILTFLSYFIRSAIVEKRYEVRFSPEEEVQDAIKILQRKSATKSSKKNNLSQLLSSNGTKSSSLANEVKANTSKSINKTCVDLNIPKLRKTVSLHKNLNSNLSNYLKTDPTKLPLKLESFQDDLATDYSTMCSNDFDKEEISNPIKIIVSEISSQTNALDADKNLSSGLLLGSDDFEQKNDWRDPESTSLSHKFSFLHNSIQESCAASNATTEVYYSQVEYTQQQDDNKQNQVFFTLGGEDKTTSDNISCTDSFNNNSNDNNNNNININNNCQCSLAFNRVPSTSAQLPEGVLRKILQRNFPESSKSIQQRQQGTSFGYKDRTNLLGSCPKCNGSGSGNYESSKLLLETPTNATEVLRTCGNSVSTRAGSSSSNSRNSREASTVTASAACPKRIDTLDELLEANNVIELPMPKSKIVNANKSNDSYNFEQVTGFTDTLLRRTVTKVMDNCKFDSGYTSGLVIQGLVRKKDECKEREANGERDRKIYCLVDELREEISINSQFSMVDHAISESLCILADVDNWQVGIVSNNSTIKSPLLPVGMSALVSNMLEAFGYLWSKYQSPGHCLNILENKMREIWLRSEALAKVLMTGDVCDMNVSNLTNTLDLDAADIPLLLAVATTHSPQIAQRFGLTLT